MQQFAKAVILYNQLSENAGPDEADVLEQVKLVREMLTELNVDVEELPFSSRLDSVEEDLLKAKPNFVFNLVESLNNKGSLIYLAPALLDSLNIPFSGGSVESMFITTSKPLAKKKMERNGIPTSPWFYPNTIPRLEPKKKYIIKPVWEEGSLGLDEDCVYEGSDLEFTKRLSTLSPRNFFAEEFIDGREFNHSVLASENGPEVLPPAEIIFSNYPEGKYRVVGFSAKWKEDSFEYKNTNRTFDFPQSDDVLLIKLKELATECWHSFDLNGYARVDFRVDNNGNPYVLEINVNPCISPDSGFYAACQQAGIPFREAVRRIVNDTPALKVKI
jgi:D-alanine-D-alanine ligase